MYIWNLPVIIEWARFHSDWLKTKSPNDKRGEKLQFHLDLCRISQNYCMVPGEQLAEFPNSLNCCETWRPQHCPCSSLNKNGERRDMSSAGEGTWSERKLSSGNSSPFRAAAAQQSSRLKGQSRDRCTLLPAKAISGVPCSLNVCRQPKCRM